MKAAPKSLKFRLNGDSFNPHRLVSIEQQVRRYLDTLKFCELVSTEQIATALNVKQQSINAASRSMGEYSSGGGAGRGGIPKVWGSKKTITELKRQMG